MSLINKLSYERTLINSIDEQIVKLLASRVQAAKRIAEIKAKHGLEIYNGKREAEVLTRVRELSITYNLNPNKIEAIFKAIISYCREVQEGM